MKKKRRETKRIVYWAKASVCTARRALESAPRIEEQVNLVPANVQVVGSSLTECFLFSYSCSQGRFLA